MEDDEEYYDPFQTDMGEGIVTSGSASAMVADAAVVAAVMCSEGHVKLRASEEPDLSDKTKSCSESMGEMLHLPILSDIGVTNFKELSLGFSADIEPGPGESFPRSGSMLVWPVILDDCVLNPGRYLPESGAIPDGPGSVPEVCRRCCQDAWNAIENEHEGPPCQYESRLRLRDCDDDTQTEDEVHWPGLDAWSSFGNSGQDLGRSFPYSAGIMVLPERYNTIDTGLGRVSPKVGVEYIQLGFMNLAPGNATDPVFFALTSANSASQQFLNLTSGIEPLSNDLGSISFYTATL